MVNGDNGPDEGCVLEGSHKKREPEAWTSGSLTFNTAIPVQRFIVTKGKPPSRG